MSSVVAILRTEQLSASPGRDVSAVVSVHNTGTIVEQFTISVIGDASEWGTVEPGSISLFPNTQQDVTVTFRPPKAWHIAPGIIPFGVLVAPSNNAEDSVVEEGSLELEAYNEIDAELVPSVAMGKRRGKLGIAIDSSGNVPVTATLRGRDPSDTLVVNIKPNKVILQPGTATFAKIKVIPRKRYLRGPQKQSRFKVAVEPEIGEPILLDATLIQQAILPKGSFAGLAVLVGLAAWFLLIRPTVKNAAVSAVAPAIATQQKQTQQVSAQLKTTQSAVTQVQKRVTQVSTVSAHKLAANAATTTTTTTTTPATTTTSGSGGGGSGSGSGGGSGGSSTTTTTTTVPVTTTTESTTTSTSTTTTTTQPLGSGSQIPPGPYFNSIEATAAPGQSQEQTFIIPQGNSLQLTDVIIQGITQESGSLVEFGFALPGKAPIYYFTMNLDQPQAEDLSLKTPINLLQGQTIAVQVTCSGSATAACAANVYFDGSASAS